MKEIFCFWGYGPEVWEGLVGPGKVIQLPSTQDSCRTQFGKIQFHKEALGLLPEWAEEMARGIPGFIRHAPRAPNPGRDEKTIVELEGPNASSLPLITLSSKGQFRFHFDLDETIRFTQQEEYLRRRAPFFLRWGFVPDRFPRFIRKTVLSGFSLLRSWIPQDDWSHFSLSADLWRFWVRALVEREAQAKYQPVPFWPSGKQYALILTHDVDSEWGFHQPRGIAAFEEMEHGHGLHSAWLVTSEIEEAGRACLKNLMEAGHEIGFHGMRHDHRLAFLSTEAMEEEFRGAATFFEDYHCEGFRSPGYHRTPHLYKELGKFLRYDMSSHDVFENVLSPLPSLQGSGTCFPFDLEGSNLLEIPTTVTEDYVLELKGASPEQALEQQRKILEGIKKKGGVANVLTHPEPQLSSRKPWLENYDALLAQIKRDPTAWTPLPRELQAAWRRRQELIRSRWAEEPASPIRTK